MKQSTIITKVVMFVFFAGVVAYLAASAWQSFNTPFTTLLTYEYTSDDAAEATGFLIRSELLLYGQSSIVDVQFGEGEKVGVGQTVAYLYRDEAALERKQAFRALELQEEQLKYALKRENASWNSQDLDASIIDAMVTLRSSVSAGALTQTEDQVLSFKSLVLSRDYSGTPAEIETQLAEITAAKSGLTSAAVQDTTPVRTQVSGVYSGLVDGYEATLTPDMLGTLTPAALEQLAKDKPDPPEGAIGKLITSSTWYFAATVSEADAKRLVEDKLVKVRFSRDWSGDVAMTVERIGDVTGGRAAVILSTDRFLSDTTLLRRQTVDIIFNSTAGIRVPKRAVRSETITTKNEETGEVTENQVIGVYTLTGTQAEFKPIRILVDDGDYYLVEAALEENPSDKQIKKALRAGDEVIVAAVDLYDGKIVF